MEKVKWIKIVVDIFDDEKMKLIEMLPEADAIIVTWFKLLCLAGKQNNSGVFMLTDQIPYDIRMFATLFRRKESVIQLALQTFERYGMIQIINNVVTIPNWGKHQSVDKLERNNAYMAGYMRDYRQKQKLLTQGELPPEDQYDPNTLTPEDPNTLPSEDPNTLTPDNTGSINPNVNINVNTNVNPNVNLTLIQQNKKESKEKDKDISPLTPLAGGTDKQSAHKKAFSRDPEKRAIWDKYTSTFEPALKDAISRWIIYKTEKRQPYKPQGLNALLSKTQKSAAKYGDEAVIDVIDATMSCGYQGITWDKLAKTKPPDNLTPKKNRFVNFDQRTHDWDEIERQERAYLAQSLKNT